MAINPTHIVLGLELVLFLTGLFLIGRIFLYAPANSRWLAPTNFLPPWRGGALDFALLLSVILASGFVVQAAGQLLFATQLKRLPEASTWTTAVMGALLPQIGYLGGAWLFCVYASKTLPLPTPTKTPDVAPPAFLSGLGVFCVALPVVALFSFGWASLLKLFGMPPEAQDLVEIISGTKSHTLLCLLIFLAVVGAPITEEIIFRGGVFRALRLILPQWAALLIATVPLALLFLPTIPCALVTGIAAIVLGVFCESKKILSQRGLPRWAAVICSAIPFAALHQNLASFVPLALLGAGFAWAYERTGRLAVPIVAHALFNLNTLIVLLSGLDIPNG